MTLENLKKLAWAVIPGANKNNVLPTLLTLILNKACDDIAEYTCCLPENETFDVVAEDGEYLLHEELTRYLTMDKSGLWWNDGTQWKQLNPRTLAWLDRNRPNWRDLDSDDPEDYAISGDALTIVPKPDTDLTDGFKVYFGQAPDYMSANGDYPFVGDSTELTHLRIFDMVIIKFAELLVLPMINKKIKPDIILKEYQALRKEKYSLFKRRKDISANKHAKFTGRRIV